MNHRIRFLFLIILTAHAVFLTFISAATIAGAQSFMRVTPTGEKQYAHILEEARHDDHAGDDTQVHDVVTHMECTPYPRLLLEDHPVTASYYPWNDIFLRKLHHTCLAKDIKAHGVDFRWIPINKKLFNYTNHCPIKIATQICNNYIHEFKHQSIQEGILSSKTFDALPDLTKLFTGNQNTSIAALVGEQDRDELYHTQIRHIDVLHIKPTDAYSPLAIFAALADWLIETRTFFEVARPHPYSATYVAMHRAHTDKFVAQLPQHGWQLVHASDGHAKFSEKSVALNLKEHFDEFDAKKIEYTQKESKEKPINYFW